MLVYGDVVRRELVATKRDAIATWLEEARATPPGLARHEVLVAALMQAGELLQGLADADHSHGAQADTLSPDQDAATTVVMRLATAVWASWTSGFADLPLPGPEILPRFDPRREPIRTRYPEGYAFYAVYPEGFGAAAVASRLPATCRVIGIRSIGTSLAAMVAAALGSAAPVTVRPGGHPFSRRLSVSGAVGGRVMDGAPTHFAIVDEGPGLSGSSFGAVGDWLEERGVPAQRLTLFPSHNGDPGPQASGRHRARWARLHRPVVDFDALCLEGAARPEHRLAGWIEGLLGPLETPLEEVSGGWWRQRRCADVSAWPPVHAQQERRKFLLRAGGRSWIAKFVGLGGEGRRKAARASALHRAGFAPQPAGLVHGFLVEHWIEDATPYQRGLPGDERLLETAARYLGFRAREWPAGPDRGAPLSDLLTMARTNIGESLGAGAARRLDGWTVERLADLETLQRPVEVDGRLHAWEWLAMPDGRWLKCDALDHHAAHDLVGCQDIAWDVAGAVVELELSVEGQARLARIVERESRRPLHAPLLAFMMPCYLAFQLGFWSMAAGATADEAERRRLRHAVDRYANALEALPWPQG